MNHVHGFEPEIYPLFVLRICALVAVAGFVAHASGCDEEFMGRPGDGQSERSMTAD